MMNVHREDDFTTRKYVWCPIVVNSSDAGCDHDTQLAVVVQPTLKAHCEDGPTMGRHVWCPGDG